MLNIANYQRNANQNHNEVSPRTSHNGCHQKNPQTINAEEGVERREASYTVGWECKLVQPLWKTAWRLLKKQKIELSYGPAIPTPGHIYGENSY